MKLRLCGGITNADVNVIYMSLCFFLLFSADMTLTNMEKTIISSIQDDNEEFKVDGYDLLSTLFIAFAVTIWLAPSAVSVFGVRTTMSLAAVLHTIYTFSFALEESWLLYVTSVIGGTGTGLLWTASGKYLILNSTPELVSRNIGIFWTFFSSSGLFGNLFAYFKLRGEKYINKESRHYIIYGLSAIATISAIAFAFLRSTKRKNNDSEEEEEGNEKSPVKELQKTWQVFKTKEMLILCITFCYTGLQQAFGFGIYSPCIGFTLQFGNKSKELIPISGILVGIGQMSGGCWQMFQGQQLSRLRWGRRIVILAGIFAHFLAFALIFINLPAAAVFGNTEDKAIIESNIYIALFCALLLGVGDGCLNTQNYSIIAILFPEESAHSCALYKFMKAVFVSLGYSLSSHLNLHQQVGGLSIAAVIGVMAFIYVDLSLVKSQNTKTTANDKKEDAEQN